MKLYLMRHSLAASMIEARVSSDRERPLTRDGEARAELMGRALRTIGVSPATIWTSPLPRAQRTAELVAGQLGCGKSVTVNEILSPGMTPEEFTDALVERRDGDMLAVFHQPDIGELVTHLLCGRSARISVQEATVVCLEMPSVRTKDRVRLDFVLSPEIAGTIVE